MKATARKPIDTMSGQVGGLDAGWHVRTRKKTGRIYICRNGNPMKNPTEKQRASMRRFAEKYAGRQSGGRRSAVSGQQ